MVRRSDAEKTMHKRRKPEVCFGPPWAVETTGFENPGDFPPGNVRNTWRHRNYPTPPTTEEILAVLGQAWLGAWTAPPQTPLQGPGRTVDWKKKCDEPFANQLRERGSAWKL